jgi:Colicin immunity protein / pyocin immunity protein
LIPSGETSVAKKPNKPKKLTREQMIELVTRLMNAEGSEKEQDADIALFKANCVHPDGTDLIYWPSGFAHDPTAREPTVEEIVDRAMRGK